MKIGLRSLLIGLFSILVTLAALSGCGGSSNSGSVSSSNFQLFVTDDLTPDYSGVWVKVYKAQIKSTAGVSTTLFDSTEGMPINLRQLNDGASRFLLLAPGTLPDGTYNKVEFLTDKSVTLVAVTSGAVSNANFPASLDSGAGKSKLEVNLTPNLIVPGATRVAVDFDLKNWVVAGGIVTPVMGHHSGAGLDDPARHERFEFKGLVSDLSGVAPNQTFNLQLRFGGNVSVMTDVDTSFVGDGTAAFTNGTRAEVYGDLNPATRTVTARIVRFESEFENEAKAIGRASNISAAAGTFDMVPRFTRGFIPQGEKVNIVTNGSTRFRGRHGSVISSADFYSALTTAGVNAVVEAEGTYVSASNTLTAKSVHIENEAEFGSDEIEGIASDSNGEANSFAITRSGTTSTYSVKTLPATRYRDQLGETITKAAFYSAISAGGKKVKVEGVLRESTITAGKAQLKASGSNDD